MSKFIRSPVFIIFASILLCALVLYAPFLWFRIQTHYWEYQIRQHQNPVELQAWATSLLAMYSESNIAETTILEVTNKPPPEFPVGPHYDYGVSLMDDKIWGGGYYVQLVWGSGVLGRWGLRIGHTNYVCGLPDKWKPGIYFFSGP